MKRICVPLEISVYVSDKRFKKAWESEVEFQKFKNELTDIKLEQMKRKFFEYPHFYYLWR